jgi:hypothetical protein
MTPTLHHTLLRLRRAREDLYAETLVDDAFGDALVAAQVADIIAHLDAAIRLMAAKNRRVQHAAFAEFLATKP